MLETSNCEKAELENKDMLSKECNVKLKCIAEIRLIRAIPRQKVTQLRNFHPKELKHWAQTHSLAILNDDRSNKYIRKNDSHLIRMLFLMYCIFLT